MLAREGAQVAIASEFLLEVTEAWEDPWEAGKKRRKEGRKKEKKERKKEEKERRGREKDEKQGGIRTVKGKLIEACYTIECAWHWNTST